MSEKQAIRELQEEIETLRARVRDLEARPLAYIPYQPICLQPHYPCTRPHYPQPYFQPLYPSWTTICSSGMVNTDSGTTFTITGSSNQ
jgi:hypothetical protein